MGSCFKRFPRWVVTSIRIAGVAVWNIAFILSVCVLGMYHLNSSPAVVPDSFMVSNTTEKMTNALPFFASRNPVVIYFHPKNMSDPSIPKLDPSFLDIVDRQVKSLLYERGYNRTMFRLLSDTYFRSDNATLLGSLFLGKNQTSAIMVFFASANNSEEALNFSRDATQFLKDHASFLPDANGTYVTEIFGDTAIAIDTDRRIQYEGLVCISVACVAAMICVAFVRRSLASVVLVGLCTLIDSSVTLAVLTLFSNLYTLNSTTPLLALLLGIILTTLYLMMQLIYFEENLRHGSHASRAITHAMKASILGVSLSTGCLISLFIGAAFFFTGPLLMHTVALACSALISALLVITFVPSLVALSGSMFALRGLLPCVKSCRDPDLPVTNDEAEITKIRSSFIVFIFSWVSHRDWHSSLVTIVTIGIMAVFIAQVTNITLTKTRKEWMASSSDALMALATAKEDGFPAGIVSPLFLFHQTDGISIFDSDHFKLLSISLERITGTYTSLSSLTSHSYVSLSNILDQHISWERAACLMSPYCPDGRSQLGRAYRAIRSQIADIKGLNTVSVFLPDTDSGNVIDMAMPSLLRYLERLSDSKNELFNITGISFDEYLYYEDSLVNLCYAFSVGMAITLVTTSIITKAPLASVAFFALSVLTVSTTTGIMNLIFPNGMSMVSLFVTAPYLIGLSLVSNNIFYAFATRFRLSGFNPESSVLRAVFSTRFYWPAFNLMQVFCFIPLYVSDVHALRVVGTFFGVHAAIDYLFGKVVLSPSVTLLWGNYNWWPKRPLIIYRKAAVANHGSRIMKYITNSEEAREEEEDDEREFQEQVQRERQYGTDINGDGRVFQQPGKYIDDFDPVEDEGHLSSSKSPAYFEEND